MLANMLSRRWQSPDFTRWLESFAFVKTDSCRIHIGDIEEESRGAAVSGPENREIDQRAANACSTNFRRDPHGNKPHDIGIFSILSASDQAYVITILNRDERRQFHQFWSARRRRARRRETSSG